jgi:hypothetical protein
MRNDPVLPAAVILRLREPSGRDFFVTVTWDLEPANRHMVGRYWNLDDADHAVLYTVADPVVGRPNEEMKALRRREEEHARELERQQADRANLYGP